jgi:hypothetical protein
VTMAPIRHSTSDRSHDRDRRSAAYPPGEIGDVLTDLSIFLTGPLYRRWHLHWGAERSEVAAVLPGEGLASLRVLVRPVAFP